MADAPKQKKQAHEPVVYIDHNQLVAERQAREDLAIERLRQEARRARKRNRIRR
jgi:hypothetical protein